MILWLRVSATGKLYTSTPARRQELYGLRTRHNAYPQVVRFLPGLEYLPALQCGVQVIRSEKTRASSVLRATLEDLIRISFLLQSLQGLPFKFLALVARIGIPRIRSTLLEQTCGVSGMAPNSTAVHEAIRLAQAMKHETYRSKDKISCNAKIYKSDATIKHFIWLPKLVVLRRMRLASGLNRIVLVVCVHRRCAERGQLE